MAVDDDILVKNPFGFQLAGVLVNDAVTREAITKDQMRKFLKFVHDDVVYCKYYEVVYILFHTGMRISEFCGLTLKDIDLENRTVNIDHQLQRTSAVSYTHLLRNMPENLPHPYYSINHKIFSGSKQNIQLPDVYKRQALYFKTS